MKWFWWYSTDGAWWFRLFGYGANAKNIKKHRLLFSERNGRTKTLKLFGWSFKLLKPIKTD